MSQQCFQCESASRGPSSSLFRDCDASNCTKAKVNFQLSALLALPSSCRRGKSPGTPATIYLSVCHLYLFIRFLKHPNIFLMFLMLLRKCIRIHVSHTCGCGCPNHKLYLLGGAISLDNLIVFWCKIKCIWTEFFTFLTFKIMSFTMKAHTR